MITSVFNVLEMQAPSVLEINYIPILFCRGFPWPRLPEFRGPDVLHGSLKKIFILYYTVVKRISKINLYVLI